MPSAKTRAAIQGPDEGAEDRQSQPRCIRELLEIQAERNPDATAILGLGRAPLTYGRLLDHADCVVRTLNEVGVGRGDCVAIVLPNGPEMAVAFISVAAGATSAPLNPAYQASEFDFFLSDLNAKALIVQAGMNSPVVDVAQALGVQVIELSPVVEAEAGMFRLEGGQPARPACSGFAEPDDVALVLHTSGTTSRPKIVPLTHLNICTSAHNIQATLKLARNDRCLNVMPLFHIHGLIGATLSSLAAGASIVCTPGFDVSRFFEWMDEFHPTWYSAVPTMHQANLGHAPANREIIARCPLRFIRSSSSSLPPQVMSELEQMFGVPVIESYGMTEASHQMTSNPLPPQPRKPGSVGIAAGPQVAIMDEGGNLLSAGEIGEIVILGDNVTCGYANNPAANESAFVDSWFRTGDQGFFDTDGYFFITGRIKEIINRGGEKIAPREIDEVLMDHPAVAQAVAFAVPHSTLGEDVAAAVVLRESVSATERELREFAFGRLADYKIPSRVLIVDEIPKGPTGKLQRIGLAEKLATELKADFVAPRTAVESALAMIWSEALDIEQVGVCDNFFALGGDSLLAARLVTRVGDVFGVELPLKAVFQAPTIEQLAVVLGCEEWSMPWSSVVAIQPGGSKLPFFCLPGNLGNVFSDLGDLARHLGPDQPFYGLQDGVQNPTRIEALAAQYLDEMRTVQPEGPYLLGGVCSGAIVAFEIAQQLRSQAEHVAMLALVEPARPPVLGPRYFFDLAASTLRRGTQRLGHHSLEASRLDSSTRRDYIRLKVKVFANTWAMTRYVPRPYPGQIELFLGSDSPRFSHDPRLAWRRLAAGGAEVHVIPGSHNQITGSDGTDVEEACMQALAEQLKACIDRALADDTDS